MANIEKFCSIDGCSDAHNARGLCKRHYLSWYSKNRKKKDTPCSVDDCTRHSSSGGLCNSHYMRLRRHGDPQGGRTYKMEVRAWVEAHLARTNFKDCEAELRDNPWPFPLHATGYPTIRVEGKLLKVHRMVCEAFHGPQPPDKPIVRHLCGRGQLGCLNPACLVWGTVAENNADHITHGTSCRGEEHWNASLTEAEVRSIRVEKLAGASYASLAVKYNVGAPAIKAVVNRYSWAWVDD